MEEEQTNPFFQNQLELIQFLKQQVHLVEVPNIHTTNIGESFITVPFLQNEIMTGIVFIGPCTTLPLTDEVIHTILMDINQVESPDWAPYLKQMPLVSTKRLYSIGILAHQLLNGVILDVTDIIEKHLRIEQSPKEKKQVEVLISDRRESSEFRGLFEIEKQLLSSIRNGDKAAFYNMTLTVGYDGNGILSNHTQLRNIKSLGVYVIALASRASIEGGLYPEIAYSLSELHLRCIEDLQDYRAVVTAIGDALIDFVERVSKSKRKHLSKSIATCQEYIFNHLYENIPISVLAEKTSLNENYLSQLFKKETGLNITQFIHQEKVEEAKKLLELTSNPITFIATKLNFYDQTHFNKIFKRYTGFTPKQYRNKNKFVITPEGDDE
ncbi:helix-turn-helix domain-containing protein [Paenibacillus tritici]|uniref:helix-turn-helix domain-containing protein n=1 Tax=Paenibacillus tritici TaxID=1873425 RepID=UPI001BAB304D|nr:helix-turn-helix domain-containing protein [Paenibacillus tritici]QUL53452.1 helix-turn-helix domain-containing protein [Paenibacillus tritici]